MNKRFGELFREYRKKTRFIGAEGQLSYRRISLQRFAELIRRLLGNTEKGPSKSTVILWEKGKALDVLEDKYVLIAIISILVKYGGIYNLDQITDFLNIGGFRINNSVIGEKATTPPEAIIGYVLGNIPYNPKGFRAIVDYLYKIILEISDSHFTNNSTEEITKILFENQLPKKPTVFISYAREDLKKVTEIYNFLLECGCNPWMDVHDIAPGKDWDVEIQMAIEGADFFVTCLSSNSVNKRGYFQKELKKALEILELIPEGEIYIIPIKLDQCKVPRSLSKFQWLRWWYSDEKNWFDNYYKSDLMTAMGLTTNPKSTKFSQTLKTNLEKFNKIINSLTKEQYQVLEWLKGHKRASISGCAGSGKTLLAAEKAIRLDRAGLKTMLLCHNPFLRDFLQDITKGTAVYVYDFSSWVSDLNLGKSESNDNWSHYLEPSESDIGEAFDYITNHDKYDAIIVDEGQDFRDTWWLLIEAALKNPNHDVLYIFYDDNQSLLPIRGKNPIPDSPYKLSKNCRNAGNIFELVRKFHPQAPETTKLLKHEGILRYSKYTRGYKNSIKTAIRDALNYLSLNQIVILTSEEGSEFNSALQSLEIDFTRIFEKGGSKSLVGIGDNARIEDIPPKIMIKSHNIYDTKPFIPLYSISSFKGLEADGVILFMMSKIDNLEANLYVGLSRARYYLNIVINEESFYGIPQISMLEHR